ncbi:kinase-like domain-containing protein [Lipomyces arxii]|uniref:kinase-like domain-containing protein n=1 Tax=Lipomyces arxii TaxID=56418 RepID=UPI0034CE6750
MALSQSASPAPLLLKEFYENNVYKVGGIDTLPHTAETAVPTVKQKDEIQKPKQSSNKPREKASALCKTPPVLIRSKNNGAEFYRGIFLGEGGFARCFEVRDEFGHVYAAKTVAKASLTSTKTRAKLLGEIKVHQSLDHPNIVKFIECFEDDVNVYILLEMCSNKTLMDMHRRRKRFTEPEARYFLIQILGAVKYMHGRKVIHRDLKLGNIFLDENMNIKIGDFGLAALLLSDTDRKKTICGTPNYIAPEVLFGKEDGHSFEVDLWSVGIILYAMLIGKPPFQSKEVHLIYKKIKAIEYDFPEEFAISQPAKELIQALLNRDPNARPSLDEIVDHEFFHGEMPSQLPATCIEGVPHWRNLSPTISRRNYLKLTAAAGIGPGSGDGGLVSRGAGHPIAVLKMETAVKPSEPESDLVHAKLKSSARILPECLSPKVSTSNIRQIVSNVASEYQKNPASGMTLRSSRSKPLTDIPVNMPQNIAQSNNYPLGRARRIGDKIDTVNKLDAARRAAGVPSVPSLPEAYARDGYKKDSRVSVTFLAETIENLANAFQGKYVESASTLSPVRLYISQWVDYSNKYGMGYQLANGISGVYFNDSTSIVLTPGSGRFDYVTDSNKPYAERYTYSTSNVPQTLVKKMYLVKHFRAYMSEHLYTGDDVTSYAGRRTDEPMTPLPYMTDYIRTKQAVMFRLSSGELQFNFTDHYKLVLADCGRRMKLIDPSHAAVDLPLSQMIHRARRMNNTDDVQRGVKTRDGSGEQLMQRLDFVKGTLAGWRAKVAGDTE